MLHARLNAPLPLRRDCDRLRRRTADACIDEMVRLARERAPGAEVVLAGADKLPFADRSFTAVAMSIVLLFLPHPVTVLRECHRVLAAGGRAAIYTTSPKLRGTRAARGCPVVRGTL